MAKEDIFIAEEIKGDARSVDEELELLLKKQAARVKVIGCGGGGGNSVSRMKEIGIKGCEIIALNTDAQDLLYTDVDTKILIGRELTHGLGAGSNPKIGEQAAKESEQELKKKLGNSDLIFVTCGLGGGCLRGSSLVYTNPKGPVRIDSIKPGDMVYTFLDGNLVRKRVLAAMKTGIKKVLELKTRNRKIYASYDHPFLKVKPLNNLSNDRFSEFDVEWAELKDLKKGDLVVVLKELLDEGELCETEITYRLKSGKTPDFFRHFGFNRVENISEIGDEEVFDITVDGSHNFISEGFVVHNTGTGAAPVVAEIGRKQGALTIGVVTLPFTVEGQKRLENAQYGLEKLASITDTLIVIPNDKLLEIAPELPIHTAFKVADEILTNAVKGITELITKSGLVNLDFADVKAIMADGGVSLIGIGESDGPDRAEKAVERAINNPLLDVDINNATGALINIVGGNDFSLDEYRKIMEIIGKKIAPDAKMISGAQISADMDKSIRILLIVTGVKSSQIMGSSVKFGRKDKDDLGEELGIDFLDE